MAYGIKLIVEGDYACFTRPEMKVERVSYDVITPTACKGILDSIYWKPAIKWVIDKIIVYNPIEFNSVRRNEVKSKISTRNIKKQMNNSDFNITIDTDKERTQRNTLLLQNVKYGIEAHFEITNKAGSEDTVEKHYNIILRRLKKGQCFKQPVLGCKEFYAKFEYVEDNLPESIYFKDKTIDLGYMLFDMGFENDFNDRTNPIYYRPILKNGVIDLSKYREELYK